MSHPTSTTCPYCQQDYQRNRPVRPGNLHSCPAPECVKARKAESQRLWQAKYRAEHGRSSTRAYDGAAANAEYRAKAAARNKRRNQLVPVRTRYPAQMAAKDARRRMAIKNATIEVFNPMEVFERDEWICGICGEHVEQQLHHTDPMSKSLDHIQPIALGGDHSRANTQLAHLRCNIRKGARTTE